MKYIPYFIIVLIVYCLISSSLSKNYIIPQDAIRVRVIANSNTDYDQNVKMNVKDIVTNDMYKLLKNEKNVDNAKNIIKNNVDNLNQDINTYLTKINYNNSFDTNYGYNYFPKKVYKGIEYKEGYYESLVVTLGEGEGNNWWCVLFPPVCMIEAKEDTKVEYTTLVKDLFSKYF